MIVKVNVTHNLGYGLTLHLEQLGWVFYRSQDGNYYVENNEPQPVQIAELDAEGNPLPLPPLELPEVQAIIDNYNPWPYEKSIKFKEIDDIFQTKIDALTAGWPEGEIKTWSKQEAEAIALQNNPNAFTPTLTTIAAIRGITTQDLATRVLRDAAAFTAATAHYVGLRHKARQQVQALPNSGEYHRLPELWGL